MTKQGINPHSNSIQISVIMPIHDTGECLKETLDSVFSQTFQDFELICVDDNSKEKRTLEILDEYEGNDTRMHLVRAKKSRGAAMARNIGLKKAKGEYVIFLDSDDLFSDHLLETLWGAVKNHNADIAICNTGDLIDMGNRNGTVPKGIPTDIFTMNDLGDSGLVDCGMVPWNKLISKKLLLREGIAFQSLSSCNDVSFSCLTFLSANHIVHCGTERLVFWRGNRYGQINMDRDPRNLFWAVMDVLERSKSLDEYTQIIYVLMRQGVSELRQSAEEDHSREFYALASEYLMQVDGRRFKDEASRTLLKLYTQIPYEYQWWKENKIYYAQLKVNSEHIIAEIPNISRTVLWGCGKRGEAFLKLAKDQGWKLMGCYDRDEVKARKLCKKISVECISEDGVQTNADKVIASNSQIYDYLKENFYNMSIMNLEEHCLDW